MKGPWAEIFVSVLAALTPFAADAAGPSPPLRVTLLGTGNPRPSMTRFGPSILVEAGAVRILVDAGRGATQRLFSLGDGLLAGIDLVRHSRGVTFRARLRPPPTTSPGTPAASV